MGLVRPHLPTKAHHVGEHDGSKFAGFAPPRLLWFLWHKGDYVVEFLKLSNATAFA